MKSLIVNADDVGFSDAINEAAKDCYLAGAITGVSVLACGRRFQEACAMLRDLGKTEVGVHLTLTGNLPPCTEQRLEVRTLLRDKDLFVGNYWGFMALYFRKKLEAGQIHLELANQIRRVKDEGLNVTHLDSHEHIHMFPEVLKITRALAEEFDVPYIRLPLEEVGVIRKRFLLKDLLRHAGLKAFGLTSKGILSGAQVKCNDFFLGHFHSGRIDDDILIFMMENLADGITELAVHPAVMSRELLEESPWHRNAQKELETIIDGRWRKRIGAGGIRLVSHSQI
ncbi:carbohydrate deacetylase [Candidatus Omnitrophota bacterium]